MTERERLINLLECADDAQKERKPTDMQEFYSNVADHLLDNGVILPPCKVGDIVYQLDSAGEIYESEVTQVIYSTKGIAFDERAIGRTVFLTEADAKKALKERDR